MATQIRPKAMFALVSEEVCFVKKFERVRKDDLFQQLSAFLDIRGTGRITIDVSQGGISMVEMRETQVKVKNI